MRELGLSPDRISFGAMVSVRQVKHTSLISFGHCYVRLSETRVHSSRIPRSDNPQVWRRSLTSSDCGVEYVRRQAYRQRVHVNGGNTGVGGTGQAAKESQRGGLDLVGGVEP